MTNQINFTVQPTIEFINSLFLVSQQERILQRAEKANFTPGLAEIELFNELQEDLSDYMKGEIDYFFGQELPVGYLMGLHVILKTKEVNSVEELIKQLESSDPEEVLRHVLEQYGITSQPQGKDLAEVIRQADDLSPEVKETLVEAVKNPVEALQRYWFMLRQFHLKAYQKLEDYILNELEDHKQKLKEIYQAKPKYFTEYYLKLSSSQLEKSVNIHVSYFFQTMYDHYELTNQIWVNMGCYLDQVYGEAAFRERIQEFLQFVADNTRFQMMELLGTRPHYGQELAEKLDIKPSTVSYHLSRLEKMNLVLINRQKHKVFYSLDSEQLTELFDQAGHFINRGPTEQE